MFSFFSECSEKERVLVNFNGFGLKGKVVVFLFIIDKVVFSDDVKEVLKV